MTNRDDSRAIAEQKVGSRYFLHPAQLTAIPGVTPQIADAVMPLVSVSAGSDKIDPFIAPAEVLKALPDVMASAADAFVAERDGMADHGLALAMLGIDKAMTTEAAAPTWRLKIVIRMRSGLTYRSEAVIAVLKSDDKPFRVLYVSDPQMRASVVEQ
jgi:general secretion pathway protein K